MSGELVLSLFPGIGLLDMAFEEEGFCVVRGPDLLWGGDIRRFHPPSGVFQGVIGGPPCKAFSALVNLVIAVHGRDSVAENLIPEYERVVSEAAPDWFLMENVPAAPEPTVAGYQVRGLILNNRWLGETQNRVRRFSLGTEAGQRLHVTDFGMEPAAWEPTVTNSCGGRRATLEFVEGSDGKLKPKGKQGREATARFRTRSIAEQCQLQGLPTDFLKDAPFTSSGKRHAIGNGVPLPMGRAIARAVRAAMYPKTVEASA